VVFFCVLFLLLFQIYFFSFQQDRRRGMEVRLGKHGQFWAFGVDVIMMVPTGWAFLFFSLVIDCWGKPTGRGDG
jgi:hypothetical protein